MPFLDLAQYSNSYAFIADHVVVGSRGNFRFRSNDIFKKRLLHAGDMFNLSEYQTLENRRLRLIHEFMTVFKAIQPTNRFLLIHYVRYITLFIARPNIPAHPPTYQPLRPERHWLHIDKHCEVLIKQTITPSNSSTVMPNPFESVSTPIQKLELVAPRSKPSVLRE